MTENPIQLWRDASATRYIVDGSLRAANSLLTGRITVAESAELESRCYKRMTKLLAADRKLGSAGAAERSAEFARLRETADALWREVEDRHKRAADRRAVQEQMDREWEEAAPQSTRIG